MKILVSPTKKMKADEDTLAPQTRPQFLERTEEILQYLQSLADEELQTLWKCNDSIASVNIERIRTMDLDRCATPAILSYQGLQYQNMAPEVFTESAFEYVQSHLRILSGFYGVLRPMDGITPYRLEMQAKARIDDHKDLYDYWGRSLYDSLGKGPKKILNLASKEYSLAVSPYLTEADTFVTCVFGEKTGGKVKQKGTYAKMARGDCVRFLAEHDIRDPEGVKAYHGMGYRFSEEDSDDTTYCFLKEPET